MSIRIAIAIGVMVFLLGLAAAGLLVLGTKAPLVDQVHPEQQSQPKKVTPSPKTGGSE